MRDIDVRIAGLARISNPTPVNDGAEVSASYDDVGRQLMVVYQVRDLVHTAPATLANGTPTALADGVSGAYLDLIQVTFGNSSSVAVQVSLKDDGTAHNFEVPAGGTTIPFQVPIKQGAMGGAWIADMEDVTGTTVYVEASFVRNV